MKIVPRLNFASLSSFAAQMAHAAAGSEAAKSASKEELGTLPEWNLADLYPAMDAPEFLDDLARMAAECKAFAADYQGKLASLLAAENASAALHAAIQRYERIDELMGRLMSYAGLVYAGDTSDPARAKL